MAEILALGISHYPPLSGSDERMAYLLKAMLKNPALPAEWRDGGAWPAPMKAEWGDDEGTSAAGRHRKTLVEWMRRVREELDAFRPDFVLIWGDDQYENFREDIIPPYAISAHERFQYSAKPGNVWGYPPDRIMEVPGHVEAAKYLANSLLRDGFDPSYSYKPLHMSLGHAFYNALLYLDYGGQGFPYPIVPFSVNCYGRRIICQRGGLPQFDKPPVTEAELDPSAPAPFRLFDLGAATARALSKSPWRVAVLASSGWSHAFLVEKNLYLYPDTQADVRLYEAMKSGDYQTWRDYSSDAVEDCGQQEILNWMCLVGALKELGRVPSQTGLVDTWIFNSSKAFLIAPP